MVSTITDRLAVSLPVVADFRGTLSRGVTRDLGLSSLSFVTDAPLAAGTPVSVLFHFGRDVAYMPLTGRVTAVTEEADVSPGRFQIDIDLPSLGEVERRVLESAVQELESYLDSLGASDAAARSAARATHLSSNWSASAGSTATAAQHANSTSAAARPRAGGGGMNGTRMGSGRRVVRAVIEV